MNMHKLQKLFALILTFVIVLTIAAPVGVNAADSAWEIQEDTGIFWVKTADSEAAYDDLQAQIRLFSSELAEKLGISAPGITYGEAAQAGDNDILLVLDSTSGVAAEGYRVTAADSSVTITASDANGLFYGCRYLIKELLRSGSVASASDAPYVGERAVSLDNGRKYFTVDWIKELIREMSWANMNALVLHFSEDMGLGIESKLYPWLNGRDGRLCVQANVSETCDTRYLTQEEVAEIVEYAKLYHIEVIPSLDSPGHMNYIVKKFQQYCADQGFSFEYDGKTYTVSAGYEIGNYYHYNEQTAVVQGSSVSKDTYALNTSRCIDISDEVAVAFTKSLIEEYAQLFHDLGCTTFDIGGDELLGWGSSVDSNVSKWKQLTHWEDYAQDRTGNSNAVAYDAFLLYMNDLNALVRDLGYTSVRMWNDCALLSSNTGWTGVVELDTNIDIWYWTATGNNYATYADAGHKVHNILGDYNYYAMTANYFSDSRSDFKKAYEDQIYVYWNPYVYGDGGSAAWSDARILGGAFGIWCDNPTLRTEEQVMDEALPLIRANAAKSWYPTTDRVDYAAYTANWTTYGNAPAGTIAAPEVYVIPDLTALQAAVDAYATVDGTLYIEESFTAYTEAVDVGKLLLASAKPIQADVDAVLKAIQDARAELALLPTADTTELEALIAAYEQADGELYTTDSFAAYTDAVNAAKTLLESNAYTQADVDAAVESIQNAEAALAEKPKADISALNAAISVYEQTDAGLYSAGSYAAYTGAVMAARDLLETGAYTQEDVDSALAALANAREALLGAGEGVECILAGSAQSSCVSVNRVATFTISTEKNVETAGVRVFDENGREITPTRCALNTRNTKRDIHTFIFKVTAADRGTRTYTVYAVLADGTLSADAVQITIQVR